MTQPSSLHWTSVSWMLWSVDCIFKFLRSPTIYIELRSSIFQITITTIILYSNIPNLDPFSSFIQIRHIHHFNNYFCAPIIFIIFCHKFDFYKKTKLYVRTSGNTILPWICMSLYVFSKFRLNQRECKPYSLHNIVHTIHILAGATA